MIQKQINIGCDLLNETKGEHRDWDPALRKQQKSEVGG